MINLFKKMKKEKGSVTLFVLIACMFMIIILLIVNIGIMNKNRSEEKKIEEIAKQYNQNETDLNNAYEKIVDENEYITKGELIEIIYPVGSIYISTNNQNPGEYLGGKWESYGEGRTIVGAGTGTDSNNVQKVFEINETGGEYEHTLTVNEMPLHNHRIFITANSYTAVSGGDYLTTTSASSSSIVTSGRNLGITQENGGNQSHNNIQPYVVTYIWKRVS